MPPSSFPHCNLIEGDLALMRRDRLVRQAWAALAAVVGLCLLTGHFCLRKGIARLTKQQARLETQLAQAEAGADRAAELADELARLTEDAAAIRRAAASNHRWTALQATVGTATPKQVWLTEVALGAPPVQDADSGGTDRFSRSGRDRITVRGMSLEPEGVARLVARLNYADAFAGPLIVTTVERTTIGESPVYAFTLTGRLRRPPRGGTRP